MEKYQNEMYTGKKIGTTYIHAKVKILNYILS